MPSSFVPAPEIIDNKKKSFNAIYLDSPIKKGPEGPHIARVGSYGLQICS